MERDDPACTIVAVKRLALVLVLVGCGSKTEAPSNREAIHDAADKAPPPAPPPPAPPPAFAWPAPQPPGPAYFYEGSLYDGGHVWMVGVDGKVKALGAAGVAELVVASDGQVLALRGGASSIARVDGASVKPLAAPGLRDLTAADARDGRVVVLASTPSSEPNPRIAILDGKAWSKPERVPAVGAASAVMLAPGGDVWVTGSEGIARRHADAWKTWACPMTPCKPAALAIRGTTPVILFEDAGRWITYILGPDEQLAIELRHGVDWASNGMGRNGLLAEVNGQYIHVFDVKTETNLGLDWDIAWRGVLDGAGRFWHRANGGVAITDLQRKTSTLYPSGAPLVPAAATHVVVVGGGPALPPVKDVPLADQVTGSLVVNGRAVVSTTMKLCPAMRDAGSADPCAHSQPVFSTNTDAKGAFSLASVPAGSYDLALYMTTSDRKTTWAVMPGALTVRGGKLHRAGKLAFNVREYVHY